jgi:nitrile hydratase accessory protein
MAAFEINDSPGLPIKGGEPVFREPWEARAFAMAFKLLEQGIFTRGEWAEELGSTIKRAQLAGDRDLGDTYYLHWLTCLVNLSLAKGLTTRESLNQGKQTAHLAHQSLHESLGHFHTHKT